MAFLGLGTASAPRERGHGTELGWLSPTPFPGVVFGAWPPRPSVYWRPVCLPLTLPCPQVLQKGRGRPPAAQGGACQAQSVPVLRWMPGASLPLPRLPSQHSGRNHSLHQHTTSLSRCHASGALLAQLSLPDTCPCHQQSPKRAVQQGPAQL